MPKQDYLDRMNKTSSADKYITRMKEQNAQKVYEEIARGMQDMSSVAGGLYNDTYERYKNGNDTYRADSKNWLNRTNSAMTSYQADASRIGSLLDDYDGFLDPEWASNVRKAMDSYSEGIKRITESAQQEDGFWSNFKDEAEYTDYRNKATADLDALGKEIEDLEATYQKANEYAHGRVNQTYWAKLLTDKGYSGDTEGLNKLQADIAEKKAFRNSASVYQGKGESADLAKLVEEAKQNPDFVKYSAEGANIENPSYNEAQPSSIFRRSQEVNNPVTFSRENADAFAISGGQYAPNAYNHDYQFMTEDEVDAYNYYLAAEKAGLVEAGTADNFLKEAEEVLNQRSAEDLIRRTPNNLLGDLLVGMYAGGEQFTSGIEGIKRFITDSGEYAEAAPISKGEFALSAWEQNLPDNGWGKVRKGVADLTSTITNQIPSIMTSTILSAVASPAVGETVGAALMGAGAAGNAYNEFVRQGYSNKQARLYGTLIGISETCLEKAIGGISAFGAGGAKISDRVVEQICKGVSSANARIAIQFGGHVAAEMLSEGIEEFTQDVLEPYFQALVTGGKPEAVDWEQAAYSGLMGALSAGLMNGVPGAIKTVDTVSNARNINGTTLKNLVIENFSEDSLARQYAMELGDNPTTWQKAKLLYEVENGFEGDMVADLERELINQGVDRATAHEQAQDIGSALTSGRDIVLPDEETANAVDALSTSILARLSARNSIGELTFAGSIDAKTIAPRILELTKPTDTAFDIANTIRKQGATVSDEFANDIKQNLVNVGVMEADAETMVNEFRKASVSNTDVNKDALSVPDLLDRAVMDALVGNITESERIKADIDKVNNETKEVAATTEAPSLTNEESVESVEDTKDENGLRNLLKKLNINADESSFRYDALEGDEARKYLRGLEAAYTLQRSGVDPTKNDFTFKDSLTENEINVMAGYAKEAREAQGKADQAVKDAAIKETEVKEEPAEKPKKKLTPAQLKKTREKIAKRILKRGAKASKNREDIFSKAIVYDGKQYITDGFLMVAMPEGEFLDIPTWETEKPGYGKMLSDILARSRGEADTPSPIEDIDDVSTLREYAEYKKVDKDPYVFKDQSRGFSAEFLADLLEMIPDAEQYYVVGTKNALSAIFVTDGNIEGYLLPVRVSDLAKGRRITEVALSNLEYLRNKNSSEKETTKKESPKPKGSVRGYNVSVKELQEGFNENQKFAYKIMTAVAQARNLNIVLYDSQKGNIPPELADSNGAYSPSTRTMFIDLSAGLNPKVKTDVGNLANYTLLQTFSHEFTHMLESDAPAQYQKFQEFVFDTMAERGQDVNKLIVTKQAIYKNLDYDEASREVIADSMVNILNDETVLNKLYEQDRNFVQKLFDSLKKFISEIKAYFERTFAHGNTVEAQAIMDGINYVDGIAEQFNKLLESKPSPLQQELIKNTPKTDSEATIAAIEGTQDGIPQSNAFTETLKGDMQFQRFAEKNPQPKFSMGLDGTIQTIVTTLPDGTKATNINGGINSVAAFTNRQVREAVMKANGYSKTQIKRVNDFMDAMDKFLEKMGIQYKFVGLDDVEKARLSYRYDENGNVIGVVLSAMVKNGDYPVNFDLTSICKKRTAVSQLIGKLASAIDENNKSVNLTPKNLFKINEALKEAGYETACLGCFVESKRYNVMNWARKICDRWNNAVREVNPDATYFDYSTGNEDEITPDRIDAFEKARQKYANMPKSKSMEEALAKFQKKADEGKPLIKAYKVETEDGVIENTFSKTARGKIENSDILTEEQKDYFLSMDVNDLEVSDVEVLMNAGIVSGGGLSSEQVIKNLVNSGEIYQHLLRPSDLLAAKGMAQLNKLPNFYGTMYRQYGSATPKPIQGFTPYNSEIALLPDTKGNMTLAEYLYNIAGVRMQSFSDFQIQNVYDYLQMVGDLAARKLTAHAYTKEISFARLLGMTGVKTNLSVMFDIDPSLIETFKEKYKDKQDNEKIALKIARDHAGLTLYDPNVHKGEYYGRIVLEDEYGKWVYNIGDYAMQKAYKEAYPERARRFVQSIGFAEAVALQTSPGYTKNCGIIGVGMSRLGIMAMLDDNRIRYIIPYHSSSLPKVIKTATNIEYATDFTPWQNTVKIKSITDNEGNEVSWSVKEAVARLGSADAAIRELNEKILSGEWKVKTGKATTGHGSFALYEDLAKTSDPRKTASNYIEWCASNNTLPVFYEYANHNNFYKLLYDFNVYDTVTEEYAPLEAVQNIYPTMKGDQVVPQNLIDGDFDTSYMEKTIEDQMKFMDDFNRRQDLATTNLAENIANRNRYEITLPNDLRKQLKLVDPIEPSTGKWERGLTTEEVQKIYPQLWNVAADESEDRNPTQITSTVSTYRKIYDILKAEGFDGTVLDASSGLGYGTRAGREEYGYDVDDIEPYPAESYKPRYKDYSKLDKTYDAIISNAVLNVLPQEQRDALVVKMGEMLNPGGRMFINVRSKAEIQNLQKAIDKKTGKPKNIVLSDTEVAETTHGSYQKGFTNAELKAYLEDVLGDGYTVEGTSKFGGTSVIVTKNALATDLQRQLRAMDTEYLELAKDPEKNEAKLSKMVEEAARKAGYNYHGYHGTVSKFFEFSKEKQGENWGGDSRLGRGFYFAHDRATALKWTEGTRVIDAWLSMKRPLDLNKETPSDIVERIKNHISNEFAKYDSSFPITRAEYRANLERLENLMVKDPSVFLNEFKYDRAGKMTDGIREVLESLGYDGIVSADEMVVFDANQIKSADPVTYDSDGNIIPLSERFNPANNDLRYQRKTTAEADAEYEEAYFDGDDERMQELVDKAAYDAGYKYKAYHHTENAFTVFDINKARRTMDVQGFYFSADPEAESEYGSVRYDTYLKMDNPYIVDSKAKLDAIPVKFGVDDYGVKVREWLQDHGYDSVIRKADYYGAEADEYIVFKPNQIKSAEPVTYADDENGEGDFIPLSKRFNSRKKDLRFQRRNDWRLGDWEILSRAAENLEGNNYTEEQKKALADFKTKLTDLQKLQEKREELGSLYHDQAFTKGGDKKAAQNTLKQMHALDTKIEKAANEVTKATEPKVVRDLLKEARDVIETQEREHGAEVLRRYRDRRDNSEAIAKYKKRVLKDSHELQKWITNPDDKAAKRVPDVIKNSVIDFLSLINETSTSALKGKAATQADYKFAERLRKLRDAIKTQVKDLDGLYSGYTDLPEDFFDEMEYFINMVGSLTNHTDEFVINAMTSDELKRLSATITAIKHYVQLMNAFQANAIYQHVFDAGDDTISYLQDMKKAGFTERGIFNYFTWTQMRPAYAWARFGKGGLAIFDELRRAQDTLAFNAGEIIEFTKKLYTDKEVTEWTKETKTFDINGDKVEVPVSFIMSLYELMKQEDSRRHIETNGLRFAAYSKGARKIADEGHVATYDKVMEIIDSLTDRQKEVADGLQRFMATRGAEWGNYVSMKRFGREAFSNLRYFPINSDGRYLESSGEEKPNNASLYALLNMSFTKARNPHANNRLVVYDIFDVFANHMASMAQYNAFALPILDALKWLNYSTTDMQGNPLSIKDEMARVYGTPTEGRPGKGSAGYAERFVTNILKAFNGTETQANPTDNVGLNLLRRYNQAQIAFNLRVVVQQPMAIVRAASILPGVTLAKGALKNLKTLKANIEEMQKYSGIAKLKSLGYYDTNVSPGLTKQIKHDENFLDKAGDIGMKPAEFADDVTWAAIWVASKEQAKGDLEKAVEIFEDVIYKTQVVDSVLTKTEFMRNKGGIARILSSFMSEPVTTASMMVNAIEQFNRDRKSGMSQQELWKRHGKTFARVTAVYAVNAIVLAVAEAAMDALRDDSDDPYLEKYGEKFWENFLDEISPFAKYPIIKDIEEMVKGFLKIFGLDTYGYQPKTITGQGIEQFLKGTQIIVDKIDGQKKGYTWYAGIYKLLQGLSGLTGTHFGTITREVITTWNTLVGGMNPSLKVRSYVSNDDLSGMIVRAAQKGDSEALESLRDKYYKNEDDFKSAYKSAIGDAYIAGEISAEEASKLLERYQGADDAHWQIDRWNYKAENGTNDGFKKYNDFFTAVETGQNLKAVIKEYTDNGVDKKTLASQITSHFKPIYTQASKAEKARLKGYLLNAYEVLGYNRKQKSKDIDAWG